MHDVIMDGPLYNQQGKHINILNVLGACTTNLRKRELLVITEYCRFGNIQKYLVCHRPYFVNQVNKETGKKGDKITCQWFFEIGEFLRVFRCVFIDITPNFLW